MRTIAVVLMLLAVILPTSAQDTTPTDRFPPPRSPLTFLYPADWLVREMGPAVTLATTANLLDFNPAQDTVQTGQAVMQVTLAPAPDGAAALMDESLSTIGDDLTLVEQDERMVGERSALTATITGPGYDLLLVLLDAGPGEAFGLLLATAPGELEAFESAALIVAETVEYAEPVTLLPRPDATLPPVATLAAVTPVFTVTPRSFDTQVFTPESLDDFPYTFHFPVDWLADDGVNVVTVANSEAALDRQFGDAMTRDQISIAVQPFFAGDPGFESGMDAQTFLQTALDTITEGEPGEIENLTIGGRSAVMAPVQAETFAALALVVDMAPDVVLTVLALTAPGQLDQVEPYALLIVESVAPADNLQDN